MSNTALADPNPERPTLASDQATVTITVAVEPKKPFAYLPKKSKVGGGAARVFGVQWVIAALLVWSRISADVCLSHSPPQRVKRLSK